MSKTANKIRRINLEKACRACLSERGHLREIHPTKIPKMMESCASVQVSENDGLPGSVCVTCFHLITKLYTFKKKMERSDRILRQYLKHAKVKQSDIINIALSQADIHDTVEIHISRDILTSDDLSEEDIPLLERSKMKKISTKSCIKDCKLETREINEELEELDISESNISDYKTDETVRIFTDGPPPLVPLAPIKKAEYVESVAKDLPKDTPPLIPIKPLVNIEILESIIEKSDNIKYQCNVCNTEFSSMAALNEHKLNTCQPNALRCNICRKEFKDSKKLIGHLKGHMVAKDYGCKICGKRYPNPSTFTVHMRTHTGERPFKCQVCDKGFVRWAGVVGHMKTHEQNKPFKCETCGKCFKISSNLERHKILHSGSLPFCCNYCGKCFSQSDNLQLHIRTYHTNERPYLCNECGKGFVSSTRLTRHMWVHSGYKPYVCASCPKAYSNSNDLRNHERSHLGKKGDEDKHYACDLCNMKFYHPCRLQRHKKTHEKPHMCHICSKTFSTKGVLNKHIENKHGMTYVEESALQPDEGVSQIFVPYPQESEKSDSILEYEKIDPLCLEKTEVNFL